MQVNVFVGNELLWGALSQAWYLKNVFAVVECRLASLEVGREGALGLGGRSGVETRRICRRIMWNQPLELASTPKKDARIPIILHPCLALVSPLCLCLLHPMLRQQEALPQLR